jgi:linear primary-alkylsulfatase
MGGADAVLAQARAAFDEGDFRWVAELVNHLVFAEPDNAAARALQADALEQLGFGSENGTWRSAYLSGAFELRHGSFGTPVLTSSPDFLGALTPEQIFDAIAIRVDGPRAWDERLSIGIELTDSNEAYRLDLRNGVLVHRRAATDGADVVVRTTRAALPLLLAGRTDGATIDGDAAVLLRLTGVLEAPDPDFAIVTP